ncbi:RagB/SusD family nutrient uptake outer membrane protein [Flavivirga rizhaonensis]|uniref:RagB/SusD family nutrient uptake outer membrane protein n=1 Tax=Flavivirga rizhaonensis TaxID=2559571 RepID=A0A4S1E2N5_9FLAO|nr:RagB/SusD family nutrient uptake outer membrane protein [Flavivirga rizhaonensis]TGV04192.1 RagB/SusD family nutrient uptake outer membrane protein [Flavivirga rizhaonensis]
MKKYRILFLVIISAIGSSCSDEFTQIVPSNNLSSEEVFRDASRAREFLNPAYSGVRNTPWIELEYYTNNAVEVYGARREAASGLTAEASPVSVEWSTAINNIFRINEYFKYGFDIKYDAYNDVLAEGLKKRLRGEAFGLRAYYKWLLLKNFAGPSATDGTMLGIPIIDELLTTDNVNNISRSTYLESYNSIKKDLDSAYAHIDVLRYQGDGDVDGVLFTSRVSREMIWALRARMALFAASPAYGQISWEEAAQTAYDAIIEIDGGGLKSLQAYGNFDETDNIDHLWRRSFSNNGNLENNHYPPSMFGKGVGNPSQNLVDAFPDSNGYPINHPSSTYNGVNPYDNRDARFERFIFYNGQNDYRNAFIEIFAGGKDIHGGINKQATRTGYYLKKYLSADINLDSDQSSEPNKDFKVYAVFSRAGLYLDFAEAAIEAYGVNGKDASMAFSAREAIEVIRNRPESGLASDLYLDEADDFLNTYRDLVRNERRIEFAFEGEYYYDVRRWMLPLDELNASVMGVNVTKQADDSFIYEAKEVESRNFSDRMYYNPIPRGEILSSNALIQNAGWE